MLKSLFMGLVAIPVLSSTCVNLKINSPSKIVDRSKNQFVVTDSLRENTRRDLFDDYKLKKKSIYESNKWRGWWGIEYNLHIRIKEYYEETGVFSIEHEIVSHDLLESGNYEAKYTYKYNTSNYYRETAYYSTSQEINNEMAFRSVFTEHYDSFGTFDNTAEFKSQAKYSSSSKYNLQYSRVLKESETIEITETMDKNTAKYCPKGYNIGIGKIGTFQVLELEYQRFSYTCFDCKADSEKMYTTIVFANVSNFARSYIYTKGASSTLYY